MSVVGGVWGCVSETVKVSEWGWIATAGGCAFVPSLWKQMRREELPKIKNGKSEIYLMNYLIGFIFNPAMKSKKDLTRF